MALKRSPATADTVTMDLTTTLFELSLYATFLAIVACTLACFVGAPDVE